MLFNSLAFLIFLCLFHPTWCLTPRRWRNLLMLGGSYFFYGWWDWRFCGLLALSTAVDFLVGRAIAAASTPGRRKALLAVSLVVNLGVLALFKYFDFFVTTAAVLLSSLGFDPNLPFLELVLPVGISFYTFQTLSYTIDIYRGSLRPVESWVDFALFVAFFPQLVAGPIERAANLLPQLQGGPQPQRGDLLRGLKLITMGMVFKVLIGDRLGFQVDRVFQEPEHFGALGLYGGVLWFAAQIYCDFCGYSLIARGTARLFGVEVMVNFRQPYLAASISEFWRRWHISLSTWLRDYLYIPLGGNRCGARRRAINLMLTMLLGGLWHGNRWNFVIWGGLHGLFLLVHHSVRDRSGGPDREGSPYTPIRLLAILVTFHLVLLAWVFFRAPHLSGALAMIGGILGGRPGPEAVSLAGLLLGVAPILAIDLVSRRLRREELLSLVPPLLLPGVMVAVWLVVLAHFILDRNVPFIYFQF